MPRADHGHPPDGCGCGGKGGAAAPTVAIPLPAGAGAATLAGMTSPPHDRAAAGAQAVTAAEEPAQDTHPIGAATGVNPGARSLRGRRRPGTARPDPASAPAGDVRAGAQRLVLAEGQDGGEAVGGMAPPPLAPPANADGARTGSPRPRAARARPGGPAPAAAAAPECAATPASGRANGADPADLLAWYDRHRRRLPWRAEPGHRADPYHVFLSEIMLQQTTVKAVGPYFRAFLARWPTVSHLAAAPLEEVLSAWAGLGYYARARNLHACARAVAERHAGAFPQEEAALLALPGIGPYTAAAICAIAFDRKASPVDGNIERVISRLHAVADPLPGAKPAIKALAAALTPDARPGDFAQAMMDLGATICTPRSPACALCPFAAACRARAEGAPALYPVKAAKGEKPRRAGVAFLAVRADGAVLLRTRPDKGLLAKMTEVPATPWSARGAVAPADPQSCAPLQASWRPLRGSVRHVFTHFELELAVWRADLPAGTPAPAGARFVLPQDFDAEALPSLMRKVLAHGRAGDAPHP